jgi:hypothetical protein
VASAHPPSARRERRRRAWRILRLTVVGVGVVLVVLGFGQSDSTHRDAELFVGLVLMLVGAGDRPDYRRRFSRPRASQAMSDVR